MLGFTTTNSETKGHTKSLATESQSWLDSMFSMCVQNFVRNPQGTPAWWEGVIETITGPLSYRIKLNNGTVIKWHVDHICIQHLPQQLDVPA